MLDTVIVGGGIAGLTAAYRLRDRDILLLEKEDVPGGRTLSHRLGAYVYNAGAQVILGDRSPVACLADELAVRRTLIAKSKFPFFFKAKLHSAPSQVGLLLKLPISVADKFYFAWSALRLKRRYTELVGQPFDPSNTKLVELNSTTLSRFLGNSTPPDIKAMWEVFATVADGVGSEITTPYHPLMILLSFIQDEYFVEGGTNQLTIALSKQLGDKARLGVEVKAVHNLADRVRIDYESNATPSSVEARYCVMATPAPITLATVKTLPSWKQEALSKIEYASQTTAAFLLNEISERLLGKGVWRIPVEGRKICAITDPTFTYAREFKAEAGQGLLRVYTGDKVSKELLDQSEEQVTKILTDELISMFPGVREKIVETHVAHWYYANPLWKPGHIETYPSLQASTDRIHYCGDYTGPGFMNGSVQSGHRVAEELKQ